VQVAPQNPIGNGGLQGIPAISIPMPVEPSGLPFGLQVVADYGHDAIVLQAASRIQAVMASQGSRK
jgi:Asp-tRNA(Asn)/Glu-tRNA(Gln) amidotransferase A subunit family amidase